MASGQVIISIVGDVTKLKSALGSAETELGGFENKMRAVGDRMAGIGKTMSTHLTLPIIGALGLAAKAAAEEEAEIAQLDQTLKQNLDMTNRQRAAVEKQITAWQNATGFADGQLRPSLAKLVIAGRSWEQAQKDIVVAMDIARARGVSLEAVTLAISKAALGQVTSLQRMGIETKNAAGEALTLDEILKNAAETMGGAAARHAQTATGKMEIMRAKFADLTEELGTILIPVIEKLTDWLSKLVKWFSNLPAPVKTFGIAALALVAVLGPLLLIIGKLTVALSVLAAHPVVAAIIVITAAFVAIGVALYLLYTKWDQVWNWIKEHPAIAIIIALVLSVIAPFLLIAAALVVLAKNWDDVWGWIKQAATDAKDWIVQAFNDVVDFFEKLPGRIMDFLLGLPEEWFNLGVKMVKALLDGLGNVAEKVGDKLKGAIDLNPFGGGGPQGLLGIPGVPFLAEGGHVTQTGLAMVHKGEDWSGVGPQRRWSPGGGGTVINVNVSTGAVISNHELVEIINRAVRQGVKLQA